MTVTLAILPLILFLFVHRASLLVLLGEVVRWLNHYGISAAASGVAVARSLVQTALIWLAVTILVQVAIAICIASGWDIWIGILFFILAMLVYLLHGTLSRISNIINSIGSVLPNPLATMNIFNTQQPYVTKLMILTSLICGVCVLLRPEYFYGWWGGFIIILGMFGMAWGIVFKSDNPIAPYVLMAILCLLIIDALAWKFAPTYMTRIQIWKAQGDQYVGMKNINDNKTLRRDGTINAAPAMCWNIETHPNGDPKTDDSGLVIPKPSKIIFNKVEVTEIPANTEVKVLDKKVHTLDAGEEMIQVYVKNDNGTWIMDGKQRSCWIAVSQMSFKDIAPEPPVDPSKKVNSGNDMFTEVKSLKMPASSYNLTTGIKVNAGDRVFISASGDVKWDPVLPPVTASGTSYSCSTLQTPSDFPNPEVGCGALLVLVSGKYYPANQTIVIEKGGEIILDINDRKQSRKDNSGQYNIVISKQDELTRQAYNKSAFLL